MKCNLSLSIFLVLLSLMTLFTNISSFTLNNSKVSKKNSLISSKSSQDDILFEESEAKFFSTFAKNVNCASKPLAASCPVCKMNTAGFKFYYFFQTMRMSKFPYKFLIKYNDEQKKVIVSFAGPSVEHHDYIKFIYARGFALIKTYRVNIEKEFAYVYYKKFKPLLIQRIKHLNASGRKNFEYVFNGYSTGGSLATLAAFDLAINGVIPNPDVYTYGSLRIGDAAFVALVNSSIRIWRIVKSTDFIVRIPTCYYSPTYKNWRCFSEPIIKKFIYKKTFPLRVYVKKYVTLFRKNNPVLRKVVQNPTKALQILSGKKLKLRRKGKKINKRKSGKSKKAKKAKKNKKSKKAKKNKKSKTKKSKNKLNKKQKKLKKLIKKEKLSELKNKLLQNKIPQLKKGVLPEKNLKKLLKQKLKKEIRLAIEHAIKSSKSPVEVKQEIADKLSAALKILITLGKKTKTEDKRRQEVDKMARKMVNKAVKKLEGKKTNKVKSKNKKLKKEKKINKTKKAKKVKKAKKTKKTVTPVQKVHFHTYMPTIQTITEVTSYKIEQIFFKFIYYTQPIGYEIFYEENMMSYKSCEYREGISACEESFPLPLSFTIDSHRVYFGEKFDQCSAPL